MKITEEFLNQHDACRSGREWFKAQNETDLILVVKKLMSKKTYLKSNGCTQDLFEWANWLITRVLSPEQNSQYAIFAAELVLDIFEKEFPTDDRPKKAIEAAKNYLRDKTADAADAADAAAWAARAARAAWAARAAAWAADAAAWAADAADAAARAARAADAAARAARAARAAAESYKEQIINYGISLL